MITIDGKRTIELSIKHKNKASRIEYLIPSDNIMELFDTLYFGEKNLLSLADF